MRSRVVLSAVVAAGLLCSAAAGQPPQPGEPAPDFPVGVFTDGKSYSLADLRGKAVVLFFFEKDCPTCKGSIPERNAVVKEFEGRPVKFVAVAAGDPFGAAVSYGLGTNLRMPIFADNLGLMEARYGQKISLQNIWQFRVIGPDGKLVGYNMDKATIERALKGAAWKFDPADYHPKVKPAAEALEFNQWETGLKLLAPLRKSGTKAVAESATKLYDAAKAEADGWKAEADAAAGSEPVKAYDLYAKLATLFPAEPAGKAAAGPKRQLESSKAVAAELAARKAFVPLQKSLLAAVPAHRPEAARQLKTFATKHTGTPTGDRAAALATELER
jgi:peroxiredoxin